MKLAMFVALCAISCGGGTFEAFEGLPSDGGVEAESDVDISEDAGADVDVEDVDADTNFSDAVSWDVDAGAESDSPACPLDSFTVCPEGDEDICPAGYHTGAWLREACGVGKSLWLCVLNCGVFTKCQGLKGCPAGWEVNELTQVQACGTSSPNAAVCSPHM